MSLDPSTGGLGFRDREDRAGNTSELLRRLVEHLGARHLATIGQPRRLAFRCDDMVVFEDLGGLHEQATREIPMITVHEASVPRNALIGAEVQSNRPAGEGR